MSTPIIKVPIYFSPNAINQYMDSGGEATSFLELPNHYAIGGYKYTKNQLEPVKNGSIGILGEGGSQYNTSQVYNNIGANYRAIFPLNNYWAGGQFRWGGLYDSNKKGGTLGRRHNEATPYIRDNNESNIIYMIVSPTNSQPGKWVTLMKFDQDSQKTVWRINLDIPLNNTTEYLYQDDNNLYFFTSIVAAGIDQSTAIVTNPQHLYIVSVNKNTSEILLLKTIDAKSIPGYYPSNDTHTLGHVTYDYLGFINNHEFLFMFSQYAVFPGTGYDSGALYSKEYDWYKHNIAFVLKYDINSREIDVVHKIDGGRAPVPDYIYRESHYALFGTKILDEPNNIQYMPISHMLNDMYNVEQLYEIKYSEDKSKVLYSKPLKVYDNYGNPNTIIAGLPTHPFTTKIEINKRYVNLMEPGKFPRPKILDSNTSSFNPITRSSSRPAFEVNDATEYFVNKSWFHDGEHYTEVLPHAARREVEHTQYYRTYDILHTKRKKPVLRINQLDFGYTRKSNYVRGTEFYFGHESNSVDYNSTYYKAPIDPNNERMVYAGFDLYTKGNIINNLENATTDLTIEKRKNESHYDLIFGSIRGGEDSKPISYANGQIVAKVPYSIEFRRVYDDARDNLIFKNGKVIPIKAKGYAWTVCTTVPGEPVEWKVEALDMRTNNWILLDTKVDTLVKQTPFIDINTTYLPEYDLYNSGSAYVYSKNRQQRRNFYTIPNFKQKCPDGAKSIRITVTKCNGQYVNFSNFSLIEERRDEYKPAVQEMSGSPYWMNATDTLGRLPNSASYGYLNNCFYDDFQGFLTTNKHEEAGGGFYYSIGTNGGEYRWKMNNISGDDSEGVILDGVQAGFSNEGSINVFGEWQIDIVQKFTQKYIVTENETEVEKSVDTTARLPLIKVEQNKIYRANPAYLGEVANPIENVVYFESFDLLVPKINRLIEDFNKVNRYEKTKNAYIWTPLEDEAEDTAIKDKINSIFDALEYLTSLEVVNTNIEENTDEETIELNIKALEENIVNYYFSEYKVDNTASIISRINAIGEYLYGQARRKAQLYESHSKYDLPLVYTSTRFCVEKTTQQEQAYKALNAIKEALGDTETQFGDDADYKYSATDLDTSKAFMNAVKALANLVKAKYAANGLEYTDSDYSIAVSNVAEANQYELIAELNDDQTYNINEMGPETNTRFINRGKTFIFTFNRPYKAKDLYYKVPSNPTVLVHNADYIYMLNFIPLRKNYTDFSDIITANELTGCYASDKNDVISVSKEHNTNIEKYNNISEYDVVSRFTSNGEPIISATIASNGSGTIYNFNNTNRQDLSKELIYGFSVNKESLASVSFIENPEERLYGYSNARYALLKGASYGKKLKMVGYYIRHNDATINTSTWYYEWEIYGSNDCENWTLCDYQTFSFRENLVTEKFFWVKNPGYYDYYKVRVLNSIGMHDYIVTNGTAAPTNWDLTISNFTPYFEVPTLDESNRYDVFASTHTPLMSKFYDTLPDTYANGIREFGGKYYKLINDKTYSFNAAMNKAAELGGRLAIVNTEEINDFLRPITNTWAYIGINANKWLNGVPIANTFNTGVNIGTYGVYFNGKWANVGDNYPFIIEWDSLDNIKADSYSLIDGKCINNDLSEFNNYNAYNNNVDIEYSDDGKIEILYQSDPYCDNVVKPINSVNMSLNPILSAEELPTSIKVLASNTKDFAESTQVYSSNNVVWETSPNPYSTHIQWNANGLYRYYKIVFNKPAVDTINEDWILTSCVDFMSDAFIHGDTNTDFTRQTMYKLFPGDRLVLANYENSEVYGNLWMDDETLARVCAHNIYIKRWNPLTLNMDTVRTIKALGACINAAYIDTNKNIWFWGNTSPMYATDALAADTAKNHYCYLAVQPAYGELQVKLQPETNYKVYDGNSVDTFVKVWIENTTTKEKVAGKIKVVIEGEDAIFTSTNTNTATINTTDEELVKTLALTVDNPTRINVSAYLLK